MEVIYCKKLLTFWEFQLESFCFILWASLVCKGFFLFFVLFFRIIGG